MCRVKMIRTVQSVVTVFLFIIPVIVFAQSLEVDKEFKPPLDFPLLLSGTFGELRTNHFHSGIDIKTQGVENKPVFAVMEGYVSRIKTSPYGFGKALYIDHPNGLTSVYGHLNTFSGKIDAIVKEKQYRDESFAVDFVLEPGTIQISGGEEIGRSGNTGSSGGPHLHFEIRNTADQVPLNPLGYGFEVKDQVNPVLTSFWIFDAASGNTFCERNQCREMKITGKNGRYSLAGLDTVLIDHAVSFGIEGYDQQSFTTNHNGIYRVKIMVDSMLFYSVSMDRFSFDETRYINALIHYGLFKKTNRRVIQTEILPYNHLSLYSDVVNNGILKNDLKSHLIQIEVSDFNGNSSVLTFFLRFRPHSGQNFNALHEKDNGWPFFAANQKNEFECDDFIFQIDEGSLYEDIRFHYTLKDHDRYSFSRLITVHDNRVPLHKSAVLAIKPDSLPDRLLDHAIIIRHENNGKRTSEGGYVKNGYVNTTIREFGTFSIGVDTIPPKIQPVNLYKGKPVNRGDVVRFSVSDNFSGIRNYRGEVNGKWILMEYDPKRSLLTFVPDEFLAEKGLVKLTVTVNDNAGNSNQYNTEIIIR